MCPIDHDVSRAVDAMRADAHICYIYTDEEERRAVMARFVGTGLKCGERVVYLADAPDGQAQAYCAGLGIDIAATRPGQLVIAPAETNYCPDGTFSPERMIGSWSTLYEESMAQGYAGARATGETSWLARSASTPGIERWFEYEAMINGLVSRCSISGIVCQYDANLLDGAMLFKVLSVHPRMIVRGQVVHNPYYLAAKPG